jgi:hypothetical protein
MSSSTTVVGGNGQDSVGVLDTDLLLRRAPGQ